MKMTLGERIRKARKGKMTQAELAERIEVHEGTIRRWELDDRIPPVTELQKISNALNVPIDELLGNDAEKSATSGDGVIPAVGETKPGGDDLIYKWGGGHELRLPNTPETRKLFQDIVLRSMSGVEPIPA